MAVDRIAVVDAHVHFWDPNELTYPWLENLPVLRRAFLPAHYCEAVPEVPVEKLVFVECNCLGQQHLAEVALVERLAEHDARISGIVAYVDLTDEPGRAAALERLSDFPRVKGIRDNIQGQPAGFALQPTFVNGVRALAAAGLTFDLCVTHDQLAETAELIAQCSDTKFVLDHGGKPAIRAGSLEPWRSEISAIAGFDNVFCKVSGLLTEAAQPWQAADVTPYVEHVVAAFGTERVLYGSDWPVITLAGDVQDWYQLTRAVTQTWSAAERQRFYHDNAVHFYGL